MIDRKSIATGNVITGPCLICGKDATAIFPFSGIGDHYICDEHAGEFVKNTSMFYTKHEILYDQSK